MEKESLNHLENELSRYQQQLQALQQDNSYNKFEEKRTQLANFYEENISRLQKRIETIRPKTVCAKNETIQRNKTSKTDS